MSIKRKDLIANAIAGLLIAMFCFFNTADRGFTVLRRLCDGSFVAGVMIFGAGVILFCANRGAFNLFGYSARMGLSLIFPIGKNPWDGSRGRETYYDYCERKAQEPAKPVSPLLIVGGGYILIAMILLIIYYVM